MLFNKIYLNIKKLFLIKNNTKKILFAILISTVAGYILYFQLSTPTLSLNNQSQYFVLFFINILLITIMILIVVRYLIKAINERRQKILGSNLKARLILAFAIVYIVPLLLFFYIFNDYVSNKISKWLVPQTNVTIDKAMVVMQDLKDRQRQILLDLAADLTFQLSRTYLPTSFQDLIDNFELDEEIGGVVVYDFYGKVVATEAVTSYVAQNWKPLETNLIQNISNNPLEYTTADGISSVVVHFTTFGIKHYYLEIYFQNTAFSYVQTSETIENLALLRQAIGVGEELAGAHKLLLAWLSILMIIVFTWLAIYITKTIVGPIEKLSYGMQMVTKGDMSISLPVSIALTYELQSMMSSFNAMVSQLNKKNNQIYESQLKIFEANSILSQKNQILSSIFKSMQLGYVNLISKYHITEINNAFCDILNLSKENFADDKLPDNYQNKLPPAVVEVFKNLNSKLEKFNINYAQTTIKIFNSGREVHCKFEMYKIQDELGQEICILVLLHDITEIDKLLHAQAWQNVAQRIAHEIKNPLTPIRISAERIISKHQNLNAPENIHLLSMAQNIIDEVDSMKYMINEFYNFARMPEIKLEKVEIDKLIENFAQNYQNSLPTGVNLQVETCAKSIFLMIDTKQFKRVLHNVIQNSITSISKKDEEGFIILKTNDNQKDIITIEVIDNGIGIPEDLIGKVFDPYITTNKLGTGIGLTEVQKIVHDHNGIVKVSSVKGKKTTFSIELPSLVDIS